MTIAQLSKLSLLLALAPLGGLAQAQPDTNNAPKAENPANRAPRALRRPGGLRLDPNMTPQQRQQALLKLQFARLGADAAAQETLAAFLQNETQARQELARKAQPLQSALRAGALPDTQIAALLNTYQVALEDEKTRRAQALTALDKAIDLKKLPKIEAMLVVAGLIGDGPALNLGGNIGRGLLGGQGQGALGRRDQNGLGGNRNRNNRNAVPAQGV